MKILIALLLSAGFLLAQEMEEARPRPNPPIITGLTYNNGQFVNGTTLKAGNTYTITANVNNVTKSVVFRRDGGAIIINSSPPFQYVFTPNQIGNHSLTATPWSATNGTGKSGNSLLVNFSVVAAPTPAPATPSPTLTPTPTIPPTPTATPSATPSPTTTASPPSPTPTPSATPTPIPTPSPLPTPTTNLVWGHVKLNALTSSSDIQREMQDMWDNGGRCVRIDGGGFDWGWGDAAMSAAKAVGFKQFVLIYYGNLTWTTLPDPPTFASGAVTFARAHPDCMIELSNEPNLHNVSAQQYAELAKAAYKAIKDAGLPNTILLGSVGNSASVVGGLSMYQWCKALVDNGCTTGTCFDWANYHIYRNPATDEIWWHIYTVSSGDPRTPAGQSCQIAFGSPPFAITEFGDACSWESGTTAQQEATQANYIDGWMQQFKGQPNCKLAQQFALADNFNGNGNSYGLRRMDLSHRPSWASFLNQASATKPSPTATPTASPTPTPPPVLVTVTVQWTGTKDDRYTILYGETSPPVTQVNGGIAGQNGPMTVAVSGLKPGTIYYFSDFVTDSIGQQSPVLPPVQYKTTGQLNQLFKLP